MLDTLWGPVTFTWEQFCRIAWYQFLKWVIKWFVQNYSHLSGANELIYLDLYLNKEEWPYLTRLVLTLALPFYHFSLRCIHAFQRNPSVIKITLKYKSQPNDHHFADISKCTSMAENFIFWFTFHRSLYARLKFNRIQYMFRVIINGSTKPLF